LCVKSKWTKHSPGKRRSKPPSKTSFLLRVFEYLLTTLTGIASQARSSTSCRMHHLGNWESPLRTEFHARHGTGRSLQSLRNRPARWGWILPGLPTGARSLSDRELANLETISEGLPASTALSRPFKRNSTRVRHLILCKVKVKALGPDRSQDLVLLLAAEHVARELWQITDIYLPTHYSSFIY
jgi:hypothetical protein